jgi:leucyl-tRNA synthetase
MSHTETDYDPWRIEAQMHERWAEEATYRTPEPAAGQQTFYCLDFFPYPSGAGLSVGHGRNYVPSDVVARYQRMQGKAVLHPMGWDAFGLPAENEAMKQGVHPAESTNRYASNYRRQLTLLGCSYDWEREINSADPAYYRWNQAFFLALYRRGLAYRAAAPVNWCESCQTVLAAEEIEAGACWRCHQPVVRRRRPQWYIRVTAYAEELNACLAELDWPEHILAMQRHWIGRHEGLEIDLPVVRQEDEATGGDKITVFTTRADTLFGVTFVVLAPEHPLAMELATPSHREQVRAYIQQAGQRSDVERHTQETDGVFTGARVGLPQGGDVPVYVAAYVLADYGTGAVMGVPAHDTRDHAFALQYGLPIKSVIAPPHAARTHADSTVAFTEPGIMVASDEFDGMDSESAQDTIAAWLEARGGARRAVHYRLRDWLVSRQRYWGTPIPIIHCPACGEVPVEEANLPVVLPPLPDYRPRGDGRSPLANVRDFVEISCPRCGGAAERETDTLTGFVCSSWYYLRFTDPRNAAQPFTREKAHRWLPVDLYIGGAEHAVGHLLYSRFWTKALADEGWIDFREPFPVLRSQGVLHARNPETGAAERMSKSKGNIVTPESVIDRYGADVTRLHLLFMGPFEANTIWEVEPDGTKPQHIEGVRRFLSRIWALCEESAGGVTLSLEEAADREITRAAHRTIKEVTEQFEGMRYNTAISALMRFLGELEQHRQRSGVTQGFAEALPILPALLAPLAPFITEALWGRLGRVDSIHHARWPVWDPTMVRADKIELAVQVNGRTRDRITVEVDAEEAQVRELALAAPGVQRALADTPVQRVIVVPGRVVNIVV